MPKLEPKEIQKELENKKVWPVYWIHGPERMKARELVKRIQTAVLGSSSQTVGTFHFAEETLDGSVHRAQEILDSAQTLSFGGGPRFLQVRDAQMIREPEVLQALFGKPCAVEEVPHVVVFLSKDLDGRKKFSKLLVDQAAVVECAEIPESEREAWIGYLAKRKGILQLPGSWSAMIRGLDPWSLDIAEQELEKYDLSRFSDSSAEEKLDPIEVAGSSEAFFEAFFSRNLRASLEAATYFADQPDQSLPLLGFLTWNLRMLALSRMDRDHQTKNLKLSPFLADRFRRWSTHWTMDHILDLQKSLCELDFSLKQTSRGGLGLWGALIQNHCRVS